MKNKLARISLIGGFILLMIVMALILPMISAPAEIGLSSDYQKEHDTIDNTISLLY